MTNDENITNRAEFLEHAEQVYREAIEKHISEDDNRDHIHDTFNDRLGAEFGSRLITLNSKEQTRLAIDHAWTVLNNRAGRSTQRLLKQIASGQLPLFEIEASLDTPLTAGDSRRILLRHIQPTDLARMLKEREDNEEKVKLALAEFREIIAKFREWLAAHGTFPKALKAGAVVQLELQEDDENDDDA